MICLVVVVVMALLLIVGNYIANKVYTQEEREECMDMATEYLDVRRAAWGTTRNVQYLNTKVISCLRSKGAYIHPTITFIFRSI